MSAHHRPLAVDLDGTLLQTDLLHESVLRLLKNQPFLIFALPFWLLSGKAAFKRRLAAAVELDVSTLPFNIPFLEWLKHQRSQGRRLILCTASDSMLANAIAQNLGIFDAVLASDGKTNLSGANKAAALISAFGSKQFDYAGNATIDLPVWKVAHHAIVVSNSKALQAQAKRLTKVELIFEQSTDFITAVIQSLRLHQWIKNALLFVPLLAAHHTDNPDAWSTLFLAFIAFSLCASAVYIINDLLDLESDRNHVRKCLRPFAAGDLPIPLGIAMVPTLLLLSFGIASYIGTAFLICLFIYCAMTCAYSWRLKQWVLVECLTLAILYTLRIIAGAAAVAVPLSFWLLAFSIFLFFSLAFIKRYAELEIQDLSGIRKVHGRGYFTSDAPLIQQLGVSSGYIAVLILALYLNSENVVRLYKTPQIIWAAIPLMLLWLSWMWLKAHRGLMHDDPIVFAIKDKVSLLIGLLFVLTFILATWW